MGCEVLRLVGMLMDNERWDVVAAAVSAIANIGLAIVAWRTYCWARREFTLTKPLKIDIRWGAMCVPMHKAGEWNTVAMRLTIEGVTESPVVLHWIRYSIFETTSEDMKEADELFGKSSVFHRGRRVLRPVVPLRLDYIPHAGIAVASVTVHYRISWDGANWRHEDWYRQFDIVGCAPGKLAVLENDPIRVGVESSCWARLKDWLCKIRKELGGGYEV